ncbi:MAG: S8 family serine peptidase [Bacteroidota bacterium]
MLKNYFIFLFVIHLVFGFIQVNAQQNRYWVFFKDKHGSEFTPLTYFDQKAIERRIKSGIPLYDSSDFPVSKIYIEKIRSFVENVNGQTRWFNATSVTASAKQIKILAAFHFVDDIQPIILSTEPAGKIFDSTLTKNEKELLEIQTSRMQAKLFSDKGYTGKGIRIAVFDAGFPSVDKNPVFEHLRKNKQIIKTWDFAKNKKDVYAHNVHGTMVLSCIAGKVNGKNIGLAPDAEFLLARTEVNAEIFSEEENWLQAAEWADQNGADIINSSLAYTHYRYNTYQMDGHTSLVAKAANMAANKGMLVINSMGNDGAQDWKILATPADADSVISVGAISPYTNFHAAYSSYGPTSVFKTKPNVVAVGTVIVAAKSKLKKVKGTSFAAPLVTGFAACAWQSKEFLTNMQIFNMIEESGDLYPYYDYAHGYGVPQASYFINGMDLSDVKQTFEFIKKENKLIVQVNKEFIGKKFLKTNNYLYYHIKNEEGCIEKYWLIDVYQQKAVVINLDEINEYKEITVHYKGFTNSYILND